MTSVRPAGYKICRWQNGVPFVYALQEHDAIICTNILKSKLYLYRNMDEPTRNSTYLSILDNTSILQICK